jgi:predicted dehydrogenase
MLKIGIFGVGHLGKFHIKNWKEIDNVEVIGFYDPNDAVANDVEAEFGLKRYDADAVDVVTPTQFHFPVCEAALRKSKHVFVEKPLANNMEEAAALLKLTKEAKVKFQVGHVERFNPAFTALDKSSIQPMFIEVHRLAQFNPRGTEVSVILDLMIHDIDVILSMVKSDIKQISASGVAVMTDTPDIANVRIEFHNGCVANLTSSRISMKKMRKMRVFQRDAYIGIDFLEKKSEIIRLKQESDIEELFSFEIDTPKGSRIIVVENPLSASENALRTELSSFRDAILQDLTPVVSELDGYQALEVAHLILEKMNSQPLHQS